jgi:hypothetical protein
MANVVIDSPSDWFNTFDSMAAILAAATTPANVAFPRPARGPL